MSDCVHCACVKYTARNGPNPVWRFATKNAKASSPRLLLTETACMSVEASPGISA